MEFIHEPLDFPKLSRITNDGYRVYLTPNNEHYLSITTVLAGDKKKKEAIDRWKARIGHQEAKKILIKANKRGTSLHKQIEDYLIEGTIDKTNPFSLFPTIKPIIDKNLSIIYGIEKSVYSDKLKVAGTFDCFGEWDNTPSLIDWKSSKQPKQKSLIKNYLLQATFYSMAIWELKRIKVPQIVIVIGVDHEEPQIFIQKTSDYIKEVISVINIYRKEHPSITL